jgi:hypothetical protein
VYRWIILSDIQRLQKALDECSDHHRRGELFEMLEAKYLELEHRLLDYAN